MKLPAAFIREMQELWASYAVPGELADFLNSFTERPSEGLVLNTLRCPDLDSLPEADYLAYLQKKLPKNYEPRPTALTLESVPWASHVYYLPAGHRLAHSLAYKLGLFYLQDPSASLPASCIKLPSGAHVLDLCAAPGGKAFGLALALKNQGFLLANEVSPKRSTALINNLDLLAARNTNVCLEDARTLPDKFPQRFTHIFVDAPCTGSAMFRKDKRSLQFWTKLCQSGIYDLQAEILEAANRLLLPGGKLIYSTCSFSYRENEGQVADFLRTHEYELLAPDVRGTSPGLVSLEGTIPTEKCLRLWPHLTRGEGQFLAIMQKAGQSPNCVPAHGPIEAEHNSELQAWINFCASQLDSRGPFLKAIQDAAFSLRQSAQQLHLYPRSFAIHNRHPHLLKTGLLLGEIKHTPQGPLLKPGPSFLRALEPTDLQTYLELRQGPLLQAALRGETLTLEHFRQALARGELLSSKGLGQDIWTGLEDLPQGRYLGLVYSGYNILWMPKQDHFFKNDFGKILF